MRLNLTNRASFTYNRQVLQSILTDIQNQLNNLSEGVLVATNNAQTSAPTTGQYNVGDFVKNSAPSELGSASSKYIITGWVAVDSDPLTFVEARVLTGN